MKILTLTAEQLRAVMSGEKNTLVVAGPGSGKTTVVCERVLFLVRSGVRPVEIIVLTYTIAAAAEIAERLGDIKLGFVGTMHAFCLRFLRDWVPGFEELTVLAEDEADAELLRIARTLGCKASMKRLKAVRRAYTGKFTPDFKSDERLAVASYLRSMDGNQAIDFDTLQMTALQWLTKDDLVRWPVKHLLVDETQDSTEADFEVYGAIAAENRFMVGDAKQAIFGFRGGDRKLIASLANSPDWHVLTLEGNFRSAPEICAAATKLIQCDREGVQQPTISFLDSGGRVGTQEHESDTHEAVAISEAIHCAYLSSTTSGSHREYADFAILARTNVIADNIAWHLRAAGVPIRMRRKPEPTPQRKLALAALGALVSRSEFSVARYWRALHGDEEADALISSRYKQGAYLSLESPAPLGLTATTIAEDLAILGVDSDSVAEIVVVRDGLEDPQLGDIALAVAEAEEKDEGEGVTVSTIHGAKGLEFHTVVIAGCEEEVFRATDESVDELRRLMYVGMTRAKRVLWLSWAKNRRQAWSDRYESYHPSRFIAEAGL